MKLKDKPPIRLIDNTIICTEECRFCDSYLTPHTPACPNGERYKQVQKIGGVPWQEQADKE